MNIASDGRVRAYGECGLRLENRGCEPPTKEYVDDLVRALEATGVPASWHSAVDHLGRALFPSRVFPNCHKDANMASFRYLLDALHATGRPVMSWYPLNMCRGLVEAHPDWQMQFYDLPGLETNDDKWAKNYCCFNSPYGDLLPQFAVEVVRDVGFDGLWFDGSTMSNHNTGPTFAPGCRCDFCRDRFYVDTGCTLPEVIDLDNRTVRTWINWRYDILMEIWRKIVNAVHAVKPDAVICFNNYRRRHHGPWGWTLAIPLRRLNLDMMMSGELDGFPHQADFQMKMHHAYGCGRGVESWWPLSDHSNNGPEVEPLPGIQAALGAISAGGMISTGIAVAPMMVKDTLHAINQAIEPALPYMGGEPVEFAAILCSQQTQDFYGKENPHTLWDGWHGANEVCRQGHVQSSIIFNDQLTAEDLARYPVVILGNTVCLSRRQADAIEAYVRQGGAIIACHRVGELDELGYGHDRAVLDDLLGITKRQDGQGETTFDLLDDTLRQAAGGRWATVHPWNWIDPATPFTTCVLAEPTGDVEMLADVLDVPYGLRSMKWDGAWFDTLTAAPSPEPRYPGMWLRRVGKGTVIYSGIDLFRSYLYKPTPHVLRLLVSLLKRGATPAIELAGPACVTMNCRRQPDGAWAVHLHNNPGTACRYPGPQRSNYLHTPFEVLPVYDLRLRLNGYRVQAASSGISQQQFVVHDNIIEIPKLALHDVVRLQVVKE